MFAAPVNSDPSTSTKEALLWAGTGLCVSLFFLCAFALTAYAIHPPLSSVLFNHSFTQINATLTIKQALLYIAIPTAGSLLTLAFTYAFIKKTAYRKQNDNYNIMKSSEELWNTTKVMMQDGATQKAAGSIFLGLALFIGTLFLMHYLITGSSASSLLSHKITLWQGVTYIGGASLTATSLSLISFIILRHFFEKNKTLNPFLIELSLKEDFDESVQDTDI